MRRCRVLLLAALAGCNALTGVSSLEAVDDLAGVPDASTSSAEASIDEDVSVPPPDGGQPDAPISDDAATDAVFDAPVDNFVPCTPATSGPRYGSMAEATGWSNDEGILIPNDNQYVHTNGVGNPMVVSGFGFNLPQGARIDGIKVDFRRTAIGSVIDEAVTLPKGSPKTNGAWPQGPLDGPYISTTYGGATDKWGTTWSASEINAATFAVTIDIMGDGDGHADSLGVIVYYCQ